MIRKYFLLNLAFAAPWSEENVCVGLRGRVENPVLTFPIKKRINTELFID